MDRNTGRTGLVCQYQFEDGSSQFVFLNIDRENGCVTVNYSLSFSTRCFVQVICSCDDLLLIRSAGKDEWNYHVFNPISKQASAVPQPTITRNIIRSGLAFDGKHFQVVFVSVSDQEDGAAETIFGGIEVEIFSSETGKWRRYQPNNLCLPMAVPESEFPELGTPPLCLNGAIHWEINGHLLVYQVENDRCELIELPMDWSCLAMTYRRSLLESQGRVHFSYNDFDGIHTWVLLNEADHDFYSYFNIYDREKFRWALKDTVNHQDLYLKHQEVCFNRGHWKPYHATPLAFSEDYETIYLQLPGSVVSYNSRTQVLEELCNFTFPGGDFNCCSFLPFAFDSEFYPEAASELLDVGVVDLPIPKELNTYSF